MANLMLQSQILIVVLIYWLLSNIYALLTRYHSKPAVWVVRWSITTILVGNMLVAVVLNGFAFLPFFIMMIYAGCTKALDIREVAEEHYGMLRVKYVFLRCAAGLGQFYGAYTLWLYWHGKAGPQTYLGFFALLIHTWSVLDKNVESEDKFYNRRSFRSLHPPTFQEIWPTLLYMFADLAFVIALILIFRGF